MPEPEPITSFPARPWKVGPAWRGGGRALIMGIVNVTPDSFFDGGLHQGIDAALRRCDQAASEGADILDIGGESTRPGAPEVPLEEELRRVIPVIEAAYRRFTLPISIDTVKAEVGERALGAGALILNDVSAMSLEPRMLDVCAEHGASAVLNHMRGTPRTMQNNPNYDDVVREVRDALAGRVKLLAALGVEKGRIAVDPGIGFGKTVAHNYTLLENLQALDSIGCPVLVGLSRKSFIVKTPGLEKSDRLMPSVAAALYCALKGASILRVHDVGATREALLMVKAIRDGNGA